MLDNLAYMRWANGNEDTALPLFERAQVIHEKNIAEFLLSGSEARKKAYVQQFRGTTFAKISLSLKQFGRQATALGVTSVLEAKGRVLDAMADSLAKLRQNMGPKDRKLLEEFTAVVQEQSRLRYQGLQDLQLGDYRTRLSELVDKKEQLEMELATRSAEFRQQIVPITLPAVQAELPPKSALLELFRYKPFDPKAKDKQTRWGQPRYVAYVLKRAGEPGVVDLGKAESIEVLVQDFRKALSNPQHTYVKEVAKELSERLIRPLQSYIGETEKLLTSPYSFHLTGP